jgi:hypothetical protein
VQLPLRIIEHSGDQLADAMTGASVRQAACVRMAVMSERAVALTGRCRG